MYGKKKQPYSTTNYKGRTLKLLKIYLSVLELFILACFSLCKLTNK